MAGCWPHAPPTANGGFAVQTARGFAHGPASLTSSTAQTSGVLQIVTATRIDLVQFDNPPETSGIISRNLIHFIHVPEPGLGLLLGSGAVALALLGRRRAAIRRRHP